MSNGKPGAPGIGKDGAKGIRVQVILSEETIAELDQFREGSTMLRGPAVRKIVEGFFSANDFFRELAEFAGSPPPPKTP